MDIYLKSVNSISDFSYPQQHPGVATPRFACFLDFYIMATDKVLSVRVPTCDSVHPGRLHSVAPPGFQATRPMTDITLSHITLTLSQAVHALS